MITKQFTIHELKYDLQVVENRFIEFDGKFNLHEYIAKDCNDEYWLYYLYNAVNEHDETLCGGVNGEMVPYWSSQHQHQCISAAKVNPTKVIVEKTIYTLVKQENHRWFSIVVVHYSRTV